MKRADALKAIEYAGYHEDTATATRIYIESRMSLAVYQAALRIGRQLKQRGMRCGCAACAATEDEEEEKERR